MIKRSTWPAAIAAFVLFAAPAFAGELAPGTTPPPLGRFEVIQGEPFADLKSLKGRVVKLVFFASW